LVRRDRVKHFSVQAEILGPLHHGFESPPAEVADLFVYAEEGMCNGRRARKAERERNDRFVLFDFLGDSFSRVHNA
jgi:hypothetical protein